jgi:Domain of unknown function (DUF1996)
VELGGVVMWGTADDDPYDDEVEPTPIGPTRLRSRVGASLVIFALLGATARGGWLIFAGPNPPMNPLRPASDNAAAGELQAGTLARTVNSARSIESGAPIESVVPARGADPAESVESAVLVESLESAMPSVPFVVRCLLSHESKDDPLLLPDRPGQSHLHSFFGNATTNASSTVASLLAQPTSCDDPADTAAYWLPSPVGARWKAIRAYYGSGDLPSKLLSVYPPGFSMIGGTPPKKQSGMVGMPGMSEEVNVADRVGKAGLQDAAAKLGTPRTSAPEGSVDTPPEQDSGQDSGQLATWSCGRSIDQDGWTLAIPQCPESKPLVARIIFGQCAARQSIRPNQGLTEVVFAVAGACPAGHPLGVAQLRIRAEIDGEPTAFSSGPLNSLHADFLNAWDQQALGKLHSVCIGGKRTADEIKRCGLPGTGPRVTGFG